jgi:pyruvate-formate lyase-activating enzyme
VRGEEGTSSGRSPAHGRPPIPASREAEFYRHMNAANVDIKGFTERFYREVCAVWLEG